MTERGKRYSERHLTCKSDDVQGYAIHGGEDVHRHVVGRTVMDLRQPKFTHLFGANRVRNAR